MRRRFDPVLLDAAMEQYVTIEFAAHLVGRREQTVRNWAGAGDVRTNRRAGRLLVHVADVLHASATRERRRRASVAA